MIDICWTSFVLTNECVELAPFINILHSLARKEHTVREIIIMFSGIIVLISLGAYGASMLTLLLKKDIEDRETLIKV